MHAALNGHIEIVAALLEAGAALEAQDNDGRTALMYAASNGHVQTALLLLGECPGGRIPGVSESGFAACIPCPPGTIRPEGEESCSPCDQGSAPNAEQIACLLCDAGM